MNRALAAQAKPSPVRAVALGPTLPRAMAGSNSAIALQSIAGFQVRNEQAAQQFEEMYKLAADSKLRAAGKDTFEAVAMLQSIQKQPYAPSGGAEYPRGRLGQSLQQIAQLIKSGVGV